MAGLDGGLVRHGYGISFCLQRVFFFEWSCFQTKVCKIENLEDTEIS